MLSYTLFPPFSLVPILMDSFQSIHIIFFCLQPGAQSSKAKLLSRIAKMGQPMLPGMSGGQNEASGDRATEQVSEVRRLVTIQSRYIPCIARVFSVYQRTCQR